MGITKKNIFLKANTIYLRGLEEGDLTDAYLQWLNDDEVCEYNSHATFPNSYYKMNEYFQSVKNSSSVITLALLTVKEDKHIGNISLQSINWVSRNAEFAILLGDKHYWGKGIATEAAKLILNYGFQRLNLHRIFCGTSSENEGMINLAQKLKMKQEGCRRQAMYKNGKYVDVIEFGILRNEFTIE